MRRVIFACLSLSLSVPCGVWAERDAEEYVADEYVADLFEPALVGAQPFAIAIYAQMHQPGGLPGGVHVPVGGGMRVLSVLRGNSRFPMSQGTALGKFSTV